MIMVQTPFQVLNISTSGVSIKKYVSQFDHASFGENLVTIDEGEVENSIQRKEVNYGGITRQ